MDQARFDRVMAVLDEILDRPPEARLELVEKLCGADDDLRTQVVSLLEQVEADDQFLESAGPGEAVRAHLESMVGGTPTPAAEPKLPARIGRYRIIGLLGHGGMGVVYEAEQEHPHRPVALKVLRTGFLSDRLRARFDRESEILGRLRHPGIAHVYEAGVAHGGDGEPVPYFAMELVDGVSLTRYAQKHDLDVRDRLSLMVKVCDAVEHAHGCGVIHRDLKPDNILVGERGEPRVLDFGVARLVDREPGASIATETGQLVGTLSYMSPEQVRGRPQEIDARSDVYALGAIIFELVAGRPPLDLATVAIPEAVRRIGEVDAPPLATIDRRYRGDVDTIVAKALDKEPQRRYASATDLSLDIQRFLADEPIVAKPTSGLYQLRKFARRNKAIVAGVLIAFAALLAGTIVTARMAIVANRQRDLAVDERRRAERETYRARIAAAAIALESHDTALARSNLEAAPEALRGWEWRHLHARLDQSTLAVRTGTGRFTHLRFESGGSVLVVLDRSPRPSVVLTIPLSARTAPKRHDVGASRPLRVPAVTHRLAIRGTFFQPGESQVMLTDLAGETTVAHRCGDPSRPAYIYDLAADGRRAAVGHGIGGTPPMREMHLCDLRTGVGGPAFLTPSGGQVALSADGTVFAASTKIEGEIDRIHLYSTSDGEHQRELLVPQDDVTALALNHDGALLAAGSYNGVVRIWETATGRPIAQRRAHGGKYIYVVRFGPDATRLASAGSDRTIHLWTRDLAAEPLVLHGHDDSIVDACFTEDGTRLASADLGGWVRLWDLDTPLSEPQVLRGHDSYVNPIRYSPDGRMIASGAWDGTVRLWDATTGAHRATIELPSEAEGEFGVTGLAINDDGTRLAAATTLGALVVHDLGTVQRLTSAELDHLIYGLAFDRDGRTLLAGGPHEEMLVLDAETLEITKRVPSAFPFAWSPDGALLVHRDSETSLVVRRGVSGPGVTTLGPVDNGVYTAAWSPDGTRIVTASHSGVVVLWDAATGAELGSVGTYTGRVHGACFHPDGTRLAVAGDDGVIRLYDTEVREEMARLGGHEGYVYGVAWSPDGRTLASSSGDGTIRLWHTARPENVTR